MYMPDPAPPAEAVHAWAAKLGLSVGSLYIFIIYIRVTIPTLTFYENIKVKVSAHVYALAGCRRQVATINYND